MKISVIIPIFNAEKYLKRCIYSVITQTYESWEIIAVDDGSTDNSYLIMAELASMNPNITLVTQTNHGPGYARNKAIELSQGDYLVFLDADDYIERNYFERLIDCVSNTPADIVFIDVVQESEYGQVIKVENISCYRKKSKDALLRLQMTGKLPWGGVRKAVRASLIKQNKIYYSDYDVVGEEALYSFELLQAATSFAFLVGPIYHYVNHTDSQSKKGDNDPWGAIVRGMREHLIKHELYENYKSTLNSFAFTSLIVCMYRVCKQRHLVDSIKCCHQMKNSFESIYNYAFDIPSLEHRVSLMIPFVRIGWLLPIYIISNIKWRIDNI